MNEHLVNLERLTSHHVDVPCLQAQEAYFVYTDDLIRWMNYEGRKRAGKLPSHHFAKPKQMRQPPLHVD
jgi:hypothetical protein